MLNPFPDLLIFSLLAPFIVRAGVALVLAYAAVCQWHARRAIASLRFPIVPSGAWTVWTLIIVEGIAALGLFLGYWTQWAAIISALVGLKFFVWRGRYAEAFPLSRAASFLIIVMSVSLLLSGAGKLAFDIPL